MAEKMRGPIPCALAITPALNTIMAVNRQSGLHVHFHPICNIGLLDGCLRRFGSRCRNAKILAPPT